MGHLNWIYRVYPKQDIDRPLRAKAIRTAGSDAEEPRKAAATSVALLIELGTAEKLSCAKIVQNFLSAVRRQNAEILCVFQVLTTKQRAKKASKIAQNNLRAVLWKLIFYGFVKAYKSVKWSIRVVKVFFAI